MPIRRARRMLLTLRGRLTLWNTLVVAFLLLIALVGVHEGLRRTLLQVKDKLLEEDTREISLAVQQFYPDMAAIFAEMDRKAIGHRDQREFVQLFDAAGAPLHSSQFTPAEIAAADLPATGAFARQVGSLRIIQREYETQAGRKFVVRVGSSQELLDEYVARRTRLMTLAGGLVLFVAPALGFWLAGRATRPVAELIRTAARMRADRLSDRLPVRGAGDELDQLALTINRFLDQLAAAVHSQESFLADAAHELRSPLAAIQSSIEVALNIPRHQIEYQELLCELADQCAQVSTLVNQLLLLAETEFAQHTRSTEPVRLDYVVRQALEMFSPAAEEKGVQLRCARLDSAIVQADPVQLRQVVNNLVDNALKFSSGGEVELSLQVSPPDPWCQLDVADAGCGIPASDMPHIFERFFCGDRSRPRSAERRGSGLGLSICQAIVASLGGHISVTSEVGHGARFTVRLPLVNAAAAQRPPSHAASAGSSSRVLKADARTPLGPLND